MSFSELARRWLIANALSGIAMALCGLASFGSRALLGVDGAEAALATRAAYVATEVALSVITFTVFALLTWPILRVVLPALSRRSWLVVHLVMGAALGLALVLPLQSGEAEQIDWRDLGAEFVVAAVILAVVVGAIVGGVVGGIQALVLRRAASGMGAWLLMSALSGSLAAVILLAAYALTPGGAGPFTNEVVLEAATVLGVCLAALAMLPALARLRPST